MTPTPPNTFALIPAGTFIYGPEITYERLELAPPARPRQLFGVLSLILWWYFIVRKRPDTLSSGPIDAS